MIYAQNVEVHAPHQFASAEPGIFPVIKGGNKEELALMCEQLNIQNQSTTEDEWVRTQVKDNAVLWTTNGIAPGVVPNVLGMTLRDAIFILENQGLTVEYKGTGRVSDQSQLPGRKVRKGSKIILELG